MQELGKVLDETRPDAILFFGSDHVETFSVTCVPTFAIIAGSRALAKFAGREHTLPVHRDLAEDLLDKLVVDHHFDMAYSEDAELGHAFSIPFEYSSAAAISGRSVLHQRLHAAAADPQAVRGTRPGCRRHCQGRKERVAVIASGGMSHFPGTRKYLHPEFDFDRWLVSQFETATPTRC